MSLKVSGGYVQLLPAKVTVIKIDKKEIRERKIKHDKRRIQFEICFVGLKEKSW